MKKIQKGTQCYKVCGVALSERLPVTSRPEKKKNQRSHSDAPAGRGSKGKQLPEYMDNPETEARLRAAAGLCMKTLA